MQYYGGKRCPCSVKRYGEQYKVVVMLPRGGSGFRDRKERGEKVNTEKLDNNLSRARSRVFELAICNEWEYFVTLTIDGKKFNRYDLPNYRKKLGEWLGNYNRLNDCKVRYMLIPEEHKDGAWHMHGLMSGIPAAALTKNENGYKDWSAYSNKFGYMSLSNIRSAVGVSKYITKYVSKNLSARLKDLGAHLYYASYGLAGAEIISRGEVSSNLTMPKECDYTNEYVSVWWMTKDELEEFNKGGEYYVK